jgi:exosortase B
MLASTSTLTAPDLVQRPPRAPWLLAAACLALLAFYSSTHLYQHAWDDEAYAHGPIVLAIIAWLLYRQEPPPLAAPSWSDGALAWLALGGGLVVYVAGRILSMPLLDVSALMPIAFGLALLVGGRPAVKAYAFPILFLFFLIPLPGFALDILTGSLKGKVSYIVETLLFHAGYPIARNGVVLTIGQYQLLVADACSGLNSIFSLGAMGLLYVHLMNHGNRWRNALLLLAIVPIAVAANLVRVLFLVLLTYHAGDESAQGFLHGFAGMFLFVVAMVLLFSWDSVLGRIPRLKGQGA